MDEQPLRKPVKVGVREGKGPPPGYEWNIDIIEPSHSESMSFLNKEQYDHVASQIRELARQVEPTRSQAIDVRSVDDFYELRDKGGILQKINIRVFFCMCRSTRTIAVLGAINKKNDGKTPPHIRILMGYRMRRYFADYGNGD